MFLFLITSRPRCALDVSTQRRLLSLSSFELGLSDGCEKGSETIMKRMGNELRAFRQQLLPFPWPSVPRPLLRESDLWQWSGFVPVAVWSVGRRNRKWEKAAVVSLVWSQGNDWLRSSGTAFLCI